MGYNIISYKWQQRNLNTETMFKGYNSDKRLRKSLSKKLNAQQTNPSRWVHIVDDDMFESICEMLKSEDNTNVNMAKDIVFKSKLTYTQIRHLVNKFCYILSNGANTINYYNSGSSYTNY